MQRVNVCFVIIFYSLSSVANSPCTGSLFEIGSYGIEKIESSLGDVSFKAELKKQDESEKTVVDINAKCVDGSRIISISDPAINVLVDYFSDGSVRQYVVEVCKERIGLIKIERETCKPDKKCVRPRIVLTDPSDRIIAQIANYENTSSQITIRDNESQIIGRGESADKTGWRVDSKSIDPLLNTLLVAITILEENSCQDIESYKTKLKIGAVSSSVVIILSFIYWKFGR